MLRIMRAAISTLSNSFLQLMRFPVGRPARPAASPSEPRRRGAWRGHRARIGCETHGTPDLRDPHLRVPDERARLRSHGGSAPRERLVARRVRRGGRPHRPQHVQRPGEGRAEAPQRGRQARAAQGEEPRPRARRRRLRRPAGGREAPRARRVTSISSSARTTSPDLPRCAREQMDGAPPRAHTVFDLDAPRFLAAAPRSARLARQRLGHDHEGLRRALLLLHRAVHARAASAIGRPRTSSRDRRWVGAGSREVTLLGQTVDSYRPSRPAPRVGRSGRERVPSLLRLIAERVPGLVRLRYTSPHPRHATAALAQAHAELDVLARTSTCRCSRAAIASSKRMIRRYTRAEYTERVRRFVAARARHDALDRRDRRLPGRDRRGLRGHARRRARRRLRRPLRLQVLAATVHAGAELADHVPEEVAQARLEAVQDLLRVQTLRYHRGRVGTTDRGAGRGAQPPRAPARRPGPVASRRESRRRRSFPMRSRATSFACRSPRPPRTR